MRLKDKHILIFGYGVTGRAVEKFLNGRGAKTYIYDDKINKIDIKHLHIDLCIISPTVKFENKIVKKLLKKNIPVISEIDFATKFIKGKIVGITGTNGKTTVTSILGEMFKEKNHEMVVAGNIGRPLIDLADKSAKIIPVELSSFQLEQSHIKPNISIILNIAPDHINFHKSYKNYIEAKKRIFKFQTENDFTILNADDEILSKIKNLKSKIYYFSMKKRVKGAYLEDGKIYFQDENCDKICRRKFIIKRSEIKLIGEKNVENILAVVCAAKILKIKTEHIRGIISSFLPLENRLEFVEKVNNVTYINDSKATNIASTLSDAAQFHENIILMLGGSDKGEDFSSLLCLPKNVRRIICYGATGKKIYEILSAKFSCSLTDNFSKAFNLAKKEAQVGEIVLLSPACASFDEFSSYEERGEKFKKLVKNCVNFKDF